VNINRIFIISGHYGSGKTEFAVSYAIDKARSGNPPNLIDLDIVNPYFRSREREEELVKLGIGVYASMYKGEVTAEIPALGAEVRAPLEDKSREAVIDLGGNDAGANVLNQFRKYLIDGEYTLACVINFNRFETRDTAGAEAHIHAIEDKLKLPCSCIINNTHMLRETTQETIRKGHDLALITADKLSLPLLYTTYPAKIVNPKDIADIIPLFEVGLYMLKSWQNI